MDLLQHYQELNGICYFLFGRNNVTSVHFRGICPRGGHGNPLQYSCLENSREQRSLASYSPWGGKKLDTTEQLSTHIETTSRIGVTWVGGRRE